MPKLSAIAFGLFLVSGSAYSGQSQCEAQAAEKKLNGAAKSSFVKKCEKEAAAAAKAGCESQAAEKKLSGAAKDSFIKKCEKNAGSSGT